LASLLFWLLSHPRVAVVWRHKLKVLASVLVSRAALQRLRPLLRPTTQPALAPAAAAAEERAAAAAAAPDAVEDAGTKEPLVATSATAVLQPAVTPALPTAVEIITGDKRWQSLLGWEVAGSAAISVVTFKLFTQRIYALAATVEMLTSRKSEWQKVAWQYPLFCMVSAVLGQSLDYLRAVVTIKWRRNVTRRLHDLYFSNMSYYRLMSQGQELSVLDPDIRICTDVTAMVDLYSHLTFSMVQASVLAFTFSFWNLKVALGPPLFFIAGLTLIVKSIPAEMVPATMRLAESDGIYVQMLTRVQLHAERIFALHGVDYEFGLLRRHIDRIKEFSRRVQYTSFAKTVVECAFFYPQETPGFMELAGHTVAAVLSLGDVPSEALHGGLSLDPLAPQAWTPWHVGGQVARLHSWFNMCRPWGLFTDIFVKIHIQDGNTLRVQELYAKLLALKQTTLIDADVFSDAGPVISFDRVTIETPTKQTLLKQLTFELREGQTLLVCGHNGVGKSSIIRCLCALWPIPEGRISRPGGAVQAEEDLHLHDELYYLPQKPCNVLGSLSDQLTYPTQVEGGLPEAELRRWLRYVDLEHLADRAIGADAVSRLPGGDGADIDWEILLSLGEQQALSIGRLLYHRPRFAILDECTSAVGKGLERRLFEMTKELGIACLTIAHRPVLRDHHERILQLSGASADGGCGWHLSDLPQKEGPSRRYRVMDKEEVRRILDARLEAERTASRGDGSALAAFHSEQELVARRSTGFVARHALAAGAASADVLVRCRWPSRLARFLALLRLALERPEERRATAGRVAVMAALLVVHARLVWMQWRGQTGLMLASMCGNRLRVFCEFASNFLMVGVAHGVAQTFRLTSWSLHQHLWEGLTRAIQKRAMQDGAFFKVTMPSDPAIPAIENPLQRMSDIKAFFNIMEDQVNKVTLPLSTALMLMPTMLRGLGFLSPALLTFNYVSFWLCQFVAPDFTALREREAVLDDRFKFLHTRLRAIAEPVAFSGGGRAERCIIEPRFEAVLQHAERSRMKEAAYNTVTVFFTDYLYLPIWLQRMLSRQYALINTPHHPAGISPNLLASNLLFDRSIQYPQVAVQRLVLFSPHWERMDSHCQRCLEVVVAFEAASSAAAAAAASAAAGAALRARGGAVGASATNGIVVQGLDVVTQSGRCLVRDLSFDVTPGAPLLVTGPNASGKSLFGSILMGLWAPAGKANAISLPGDAAGLPPPSTIAAAPQRIYIPLGPLHNQLSYPEVISAAALAPPFRLLAQGSPAAAAGGCTERLRAHFAGLGAVEVSELVAQASSVQKLFIAWADFPSAEALLKSIARPEAWVVDGTSFKVVFGESAAEMETMKEHKASVLPNLPQMMAVLRAVGIEHVVSREPEGWLAERIWEDTLSGGEQQRLCLARVFYRRPTFGLLDECTSMVAADAEEDLYRRLIHDWGVTPIALTQRLFLPELFGRELALGARNADGWELTTC